MPTIPEAFALAVQHHQAGRASAAAQIYRQILAVEPNHAPTLHLLGVVAGQQKQFASAIEYIQRAIQLKEDEAPFHFNLGHIYQELGKLDEAVACYRRVIELHPDSSEALLYLGHISRRQGKANEAIAFYRRTLKLTPRPEIHYQLAALLQQQGQRTEAIAAYRKACEQKPAYFEAHHRLGIAWQEQGQLDEAINCYRRALALDPNYAETHNNLGAALQLQGHLAAALDAYRRAVELKPHYAEAHYNLGIVYQELGHIDKAVDCYQQELLLKPEHAEAYNNLGNALKEQGHFDEAVRCIQRAIELKPDYAEARLNLSFVRLLRGDFERGWPDFESRWQLKGVNPRRCSQPQWDGGSLQGKTILLHAEQGLGDSIQFVRYASLVKARGATIVLECQRPLLALLECCPVDQVHAAGTELPTFDVHAPLMSLPGIFRTDLNTIPADVPYLSVDPSIVEQWRSKLSPYDGFKIGIAWQGNPKHGRDRWRSFPLSSLARLAQIPGVRLISLQKGAGTEQLAEVRDSFSVVDLAEILDPNVDAMLETAAVMKNLDLVISCDSAVAHLAGALGVPVWIALPKVPDWRWQLERTDSPWYPTMRLYRQHERAHWEPVFAEMERSLREICMEYV